MENFIKAMLKAGIIMKSESIGLRIYNHIKLSDEYRMSIQCSVHHHCNPRKLTGVIHYDAYEIAFLHKELGFSYPDKLNEFPRKQELDLYYDGTIFSYVPKDLVEELYNFLTL